MGGARAGGAAVGASGGSGQRAACSSRAATSKDGDPARWRGCAATHAGGARASREHAQRQLRPRHTTRPLSRVGVARTRLAGAQVEEARRRARSSSARWTTAARASSGAREVEHQVSRAAVVASPPSRAWVRSLWSFGARQRLGAERDDHHDPGLFGHVYGGPWQLGALGIRRIGQRSEEKGRLGAAGCTLISSGW